MVTDNDKPSGNMSYEEIVDEAKRILLVLKSCSDYNEYGEDFKQIENILDSGVKTLSLTAKYKSKILTAKILTRIINSLVLKSTSKNSNSKYERTALKLEQLLAKLGYGLYEMPVGQVYDANLDTYFARVSKVKRENGNGFSNNNETLYILNSTFGCVRNHTDGTGNIVEKASVELSDVEPNFNSAFVGNLSEKFEG